MTDTFLKYQGNSLGVRLPAAVPGPPACALTSACG